MLPPRDETSNSKDTGGRCSAIRQLQSGTILETLAPVALSALFVAEFGQHIREPLMRLRMARVQAQSSFIVLAGGRELAAFVEHIAQVYVAHGIAGMARHGLRVGGARRGAISAGVQQRAQIVQREPVRGLARQHIEICVSRFRSPAHFVQQTGALESRGQRAGIGDLAVRSRRRFPRACGADPRSLRLVSWRVPGPRSFPPEGRSRGGRCGDSRWPREWPGARPAWSWTAQQARTPGVQRRSG